MAENYEGLNFEGFAHKKTAEYIKKKYDKVFSTREEREDPLYQSVYSMVTDMIYATKDWFETSSRSYNIKPKNIS